jgi:methylenetetrahydrofolate reductase (NADPH)
MAISSRFSGKSPSLSFELFPPRTATGEESLYGHVSRLMEFQPDFITCTYGAGGSTRDKTLEITHRVREMFSVPVASHLTLVDASQDDLRRYLAEAQRLGIDNIVALRGDPPSGRGYFQAAEGGLRYANELVSLIRGEFPGFGVAVAGYPETHVEATSAEADLANLKRKVDAGADIIITQLFYDNDDFFRFRDRCRKSGIQVPIVAGLLPVLGLQQVKRITALCGSQLPERLAKRLGENPDDPQWQAQVGVSHATNQVCELLANEVDGLHFYVLNKSESILSIFGSLKNIGAAVSRHSPPGA